MKTGLVLEGGGLRGLYTDGVLDCLMDNNFLADYVIGVSAGACAAVSYLSGQRGRSFRINTDYLEDKRYVGLESLIKTHSMFGMDFLFDEIPHRLDPFDYEAFHSTPAELVVGVTDVHTGKPAYFGKDAVPAGDSTLLRASSSIPVFSPAVSFRGGLYLDGGTTDPIPVRKALADGCDRLLIVLTRDRTYRKKPEGIRTVYHHVFRRYPEMARALDRRACVYNDTLDYIRTLEREGRALVIAPQKPVLLGRFEKDRRKLEDLYKTGMLDAKIALTKLAKGRSPQL